MENTEIQNIKTIFDRSFNGPAWHGPDIKSVLKEISHEEALKKVGDSHNIAEIVFHMIAWRNFLINNLKGQKNYEVSDEENFKKIDNISEADWTKLKDRLENSQNEMLELLSRTNETILDQKVGARKYTYYILMHGVIQHDLYHLGQIELIRKHA